MDYSLHIGPVFHDGQMQQNFTGSFANAGDLTALKVNGTNVFRFHESLADHRGRTQHLILPDADTDVAIIRGGETFVVDPSSDFADFFFQSAVVDSTIP